MMFYSNAEVIHDIKSQSFQCIWSFICTSKFFR